MDRDHAGMRERDDRRRLEGREQPLELREPGRRGVHHQVLATARRDDGAEHGVDGVELRGPFLDGRRVGDEDRLRLEDVADLAQPVHDERRAGRHQVDDAFGQAEARRDLDRAGDRDDLDRDGSFLEEPAGRVGMGGRDPMTGEVLDRLVRRVVGDGRREPAPSIAERSDHGQLGAGLVEEIDAGDAEVSHPVADELDHVVGPDEQDVEVVVLDQRDQASIVLLEHQAGVMQQPQRRFDEPALVGDGEAQAAGHRSPATG